ncbi:MAG: 2OG-Fe(II) oxygenase, partial [Cyanobacteria bacterium J06636_27]
DKNNIHKLIPEFSVSHVEMQMTAHNDGAFYKAHTDAGSEKTKTRELTYVYYFYQEPKQFSGGELKIYDTEVQGKKVIQKENSQVIEPRNNSIVFFNSRCKHEVLPISCSSNEFKASRFTLNGWLRR